MIFMVPSDSNLSHAMISILVLVVSTATGICSAKGTDSRPPRLAVCFRLVHAV